MNHVVQFMTHQSSMEIQALEMLDYGGEKWIPKQ